MDSKFTGKRRKAERAATREETITLHFPTTMEQNLVGNPKLRRNRKKNANTADNLEVTFSVPEEQTGSIRQETA